MADLLILAAPIAMGAVVLVLLLGLINMMRNGSASRSQNLMRWRVGLQFVAVIIVMTAFYFTSA
ncbi:MAG: twin transmembrane helix small protein [Parvibaculum sp.]